MVLFIDAVGANTGGNITILNNILYHFSTIDKNMKMIVFIEKQSLIKNEIYRADTIQIVPIEGYDSLWKKVFWQEIVCQRKAKKLKANALLSITNIGSISPKVPTFVYFHQSLLFYSNKKLLHFFGAKKFIKFKIQKLITLLGFYGAKKIFIQTNAVKESILIQHQNLGSKIEVCYPAVNTTIFQDTKKEKQKGTNILSFLYLSHPAEYKNFEVLFDAANELKQKGHKVKFILTLESNLTRIFDEGYKKLIIKYFKKIETYNIHEYFELIGIVTTSQEKNNLIRNCDFIINPSYIESFPQTFIEGMTYGKPFIAADEPYAREICGNAAIYFKTESGKDLSTKISQIIENKHTITDLENFSKKQLKLFTPSKNWAKLHQIIATETQQMN